MSYPPGYTFQVLSTHVLGERGKLIERPPVLYDAPWDHDLPADAQTRQPVATLFDGVQVTVLENKGAAIRVRTLSNEEGWLG